MLVHIIVMMILISMLQNCGETPSVSESKYDIIPDGYISSETYNDPDGFRDYTDYHKYFYDSSEKFEDNKNFSEVTVEEIENIKSYCDNFRDWMQALDRLDEFDFDESSITAGDYVRIVTDDADDNVDELAKFDNYTLYFFDTQSLTLYYFHNST